MDYKGLFAMSSILGLVLLSEPEFGTDPGKYLMSYSDSACKWSYLVIVSLIELVIEKFFL